MTFRYDGEFDPLKIASIAEGVRQRSEGMPGLREDILDPLTTPSRRRPVDLRRLRQAHRLWTDYGDGFAVNPRVSSPIDCGYNQ